MKGANRITLLGNFGHTPELKHTKDDMAILKNTLATNRRKKNKATGEYEDDTCWHNLVFFGKSAEIAAQYTAKGDTIYIEGRVNHDNYRSPCGKCGEDILKYRYEVIVDDFVLLGKRGDRPSGERPQSAERARSDVKALSDLISGNQPEDTGDVFDDDIQF